MGMNEMGLGYFNGKYIDLNEKVVPIDERAHQFGDGVYEMIRIYNGTPFMLEEHLERLIRSAKEIKLALTENIDDFTNLVSTGVEKSGLQNCYVYIQITRGIAPRNHLFPNVPVSIAMTIRELNAVSTEMRENGVTAITHPDERWANCYIKSLNLLPNVLAKQVAHEAGGFEAILIKDGYVTEGTSSNVFIVKDGAVITAPLTKQILPGITRIAVEKVAARLNIPFVEKYFIREELLEADEAFVTSTGVEILPVVKVDDKEIGTGRPGEVSTRLFAGFQTLVAEG